MFGFQPTSQIFSHALILFAFDDYKSFAILQSQVHEYWARMMGSSMKNDPRYTPSSCFQTFPFPISNPTSDQQMEDLGRTLYTVRSNYMKKHHIGMTETWNRLMKENNEYYHSKDIKNIRQIRYDMDKSVLQAYGWDDLEPTDHQEIITRLRHLNFCRVLDEVLDEHDTETINLLFNNAGIGGGGSFVIGDKDEWERCFAVCWYGVYYCSRAFMQHIVDSDEGHIINTSSVNGFWASLGGTPHTSYSAAKFAVKGFSEALIDDFKINAPHVGVSVVMPGHIGTSIAENTGKILGGERTDEDYEKIKDAPRDSVQNRMPHSKEVDRTCKPLAALI